jgi:hypothetical protein
MLSCPLLDLQICYKFALVTISYLINSCRDGLCCIWCLVYILICCHILSKIFTIFICIGSKMSSTGVSDRAPNGPRYVNKTCRCGHRAWVRISESNRNMNKLYYCCPIDKCGFFEWCVPINELGASSSTVDVSQVLLHQLRDDILSLRNTFQPVVSHVVLLKRLITVAYGMVVCFALLLWFCF